MELKTILLDIYPEGDATITYEILMRYNLLPILNVAIVNVKKFNEEHDHRNNNLTFSNIGTIASAFLSGINSKLSSVLAADEKKNLELIISDIAFVLIKSILDNYEGDRTLVLSSIYDSLRTTCEFHNYDFEALHQAVPLRRCIEVQPGKTIKTVNSAARVYYRWNSNMYNLHTLSRDLKSRDVIKRTREFHKLFESPTADFTVSFNKNYHNELIVLFDTLFDKNHILPVGRKGHFVPLQTYAVDFENNSLITKPPKTIKYTLKKNSTKWHELTEKVEKWLTGFR